MARAVKRGKTAFTLANHHCVHTVEEAKLKGKGGEAFT